MPDDVQGVLLHFGTELRAQRGNGGGGEVLVLQAGIFALEIADLRQEAFTVELGHESASSRTFRRNGALGRAATRIDGVGQLIGGLAILESGVFGADQHGGIQTVEALTQGLLNPLITRHDGGVQARKALCGGVHQAGGVGIVSRNHARESLTHRHIGRVLALK